VTTLPLAIETHNLTKRYPRPGRLAGLALPFAAEGGTLAVDDLSIEIEQGEIFGLVGPNGAGKTTLVKLLTTLILPTAGTARVNGHDLSDENGIRRSVGLVTENESSFYPRLSGRQNLRFYAGLYGLSASEARRAIARLSSLLGLDEFLDRRFDTCSTGMRHRLALARGLVHDPPVLFLDEPTRSLDPLAAASFRETVYQLAHREGRTVFLVTHNLDEAAELCHRVGLMLDGRVQAIDAPEAIRHLLQQVGARHRRDLTPRRAAPQREARVSMEGESGAMPRPYLQGLRKALLFFYRDFRTQASYRFSFVLHIVAILFSVASFYFVGQLFGGSAAPYLSDYGGNYFPFALVGIAFAGFQSVALRAFSRTIRSAQTTGTLEAVLVTPTRLSTILFASCLWNFAFTSLTVVVYLLVGATLFGASLGRANLLAGIVVLGLTILALSSIGILSACFVMVFKRGAPIEFLIGGLSTLLGGVYYPVEVLPHWLQKAARLFPLTYSLDAARRALLVGEPLTALAPQVLALVAFAALLLPLSLLAFRCAVRQAKRDGSLTQF